MIGELPATFESDAKGDVKLAPERFKNASELQEVCKGMISADRPRSKMRAVVDGQADGNSVYSLAQLKAKGQGWRARNNWRGLEGALSGMGNAFYDLNTEVEPCVRVFLDYGQGDERVRWQECIAKNYSRMIMSQWPAFDHHIQLRNTTMLRHGLGAHVWPVKNKWEMRTPRAGSLLFPEDTSVDFQNEGESFMLREFVPAHVLYGYIRGRTKWNKEAVLKTMALASKSWKGGEMTPEAFQASMKQGDYGTSMSRQAGVWLNYFFIIEIDSRKISQYIIAEDLPVPDYLFKEREKFDNFDEVLTLFPYEIPSTATVHAIRGFGARSRQHYQTMDKVYNAMTDNTLLSMYPQFQVQGTPDPDKLRLMKVGAMTIYPQGVVPSIMTFPPLATNGIPLTRELQASVRDNNETYLNDTPEPRDRETALSFSMRSQDTARVSKGTHNLYYRGVTRFHKKCLLTALKENSQSTEPWAVIARDFKKRCLADGVPPEALTHIEDVEAMRSIGAGSASARLQALSQIFSGPVYMNAPESKKIAAERDLTSALVGYAQTDRYARSQDDNEKPDSDDSIIALENDALSKGGEAVAADTQNHVKHGQGHLDKASQIVQAVQQGQMDPAQALGAIQQLGAHVAQHLQQLEGNPARKREYDQLYQEWQALSSIADQLQQQVDEMQQAAQEPSPEDQISDNLKIGMAKVSADGAIKEKKFSVDTSLKFRKAAATERLQDIKTAAQIRRQEAQQKNQLRTPRKAA